MSIMSSFPFSRWSGQFSSKSFSTISTKPPVGIPFQRINSTKWTEKPCLRLYKIQIHVVYCGQLQHQHLTLINWFRAIDSRHQAGQE
jgi:hypothetical protein